MTTSQEVDSSSDQITQVCNFCNTSVSDGYCAECEDFMCQSCFDIHTRARACRHHVLIDDVNHPNFNKKTFSEPCKQHPNQVLEFYCVDHTCIGCIRCFFPKHRNCNYENVEDAAHRFKENGEDKRFKKKIDRLIQVYTNCTNQSEIDTSNVAEVNKKVVNDINSFADRVISHTVEYKNCLLERSERLHRENETCLEKRSNDLASVGEDIEICEVKLNNGEQDDKLFLVSVELTPKIKELEKKVSSIGRPYPMKKYDFQPNMMILKMLEESMCFGEICNENERITRKTQQNTPRRQKKSVLNDERRLDFGNNCVICMDTMTDPKTIKCGDTFCSDCIDRQFQYKKQCPICYTIFGIITGDQPVGTMKGEVRGNFH